MLPFTETTITKTLHQVNILFKLNIKSKEKSVTTSAQVTFGIIFKTKGNRREHGIYIYIYN